jgi:phosphatidate cytidylyltransferase
MMFNETFKRSISSVILVIGLYLILKIDHIYFNILLITIFFIASFEWYNLTKNFNYKALGLIFLILSFLSVFLIRNQSDGNNLFIFVLVICVLTDIGGYIFGKVFKGPKLTRISPNKTYSGTFGGFALSILLTSILINYSILDFKINLDINLISIVLMFLISAISQCGDLIISYFKRKSGKKDTGLLIPGHGGILDRIDGMIFAYPFFYLVNNILNL